MKTRNTKQKNLIMRILKNTTSHPNAEMVFEEARKELPSLSLGTVYRNLLEMSSANQILKLNTGLKKERFDGNTEDHHHFLCTNCGKVIDLNLKIELDEMLEEQCNISADSHMLMFYGVCPDCKKTQ